MKKEVVLLGYAYSKKEIDWGTKAKIWIMNDMYKTAKRFDRLFDIHSRENLEQRNVIKDFSKIKTQILMQNKHADIPFSARYPLREIIDHFYFQAMGDRIFLTCTVSYMIALAIYEKYDKITLLGIDEAIDSEYKDEMPSVLYWLGVAYGKGIQIEISHHSPLLKGYYIYGYEEQKRNYMNDFLNTERDRLTEIQQNAKKHQDYFLSEHNKCIGAISILEHIQKLTNEI